MPLPNCEPVDIVGPICESSDYLAKDRYLPAVKRDDYLVTFSAGAYGTAMSSNYNSRPRGAEVMVDGKTVTPDPSPGDVRRSCRARAALIFGWPGDSSALIRCKPFIRNGLCKLA